VYTVSGVGIAGGGVQFYKITLSYQHELGEEGLHFTAANMCHGPFGNVYGKDFICVQSMDGNLSFFEQDHFAFSRNLDCLLPGNVKRRFFINFLSGYPLACVTEKNALSYSPAFAMKETLSNEMPI
jgi:hypothetical protein